LHLGELYNNTKTLKTPFTGFKGISNNRPSLERMNQKKEPGPFLTLKLSP
jgi:hypothetical protein